MLFGGESRAAAREDGRLRPPPQRGLAFPLPALPAPCSRQPPRRAARRVAGTSLGMRSSAVLLAVAVGFSVDLRRSGSAATMDVVVAPVNASHFFSAFFEAQPLHLRQREQSYLAGTCSSSVLDDVLEEGFAALASLIQFLKSTPSGQGSLWDRVTLLVTSEFARTPERNGRGGRDHHLASSCLIAGPGIAGNQTIGATNDVDMGAQPIDLSTGAVTPDGITVRPPDVHATLLKSMGLHYDHIENQDPQIISAALK